MYSTMLAYILQSFPGAQITPSCLTFFFRILSFQQNCSFSIGTIPSHRKGFLANDRRVSFDENITCMTSDR